MDLALFDFDGTLTKSDSFVPFLRFASSRFRWIAGVALLTPISLAYRFGIVAPSVARQCASIVAFAGRKDSHLHALGDRFADEVIANNLRRDALEKFEWHQRRGDHVVIVSASLHFYLTPWCRKHNAALLCTSTTSARGRSTGVYLGSDCSGEEKARRVRSALDLSQFSRVWAYGDTPEDFAMLRLANEKWFRGRAVDVLPES